ncbi:MAG: hypothetical protein RMJ51_03205 [Candidatus Calescibacterium sp.]|nr:hypothetical protein [Candidatus Calescibacterium sp.]MCX7972844.1 hypothetical protein [bacterium]MDW8195234.1 hypothetical protein [Candidatus Calescibacterium sp.]
MTKYTSGIIIDRSTLPKGERLLIFSKDLGLCHFIYPYKVKNLNLDILNLISFQVKKNKDYMFIPQYIVINYYENIRSSYHKKVVVQFVFEIIKKVIPENQVEEKLYKLLVSFINSLEKTSDMNVITKNLTKFLNFLIREIGYSSENSQNLIDLISKLESLVNIEIKSKHLLFDKFNNEEV